MVKREHRSFIRNQKNIREEFWLTKGVNKHGKTNQSANECR